MTVYAPDGKVPLHPPVLSEGAASLLPGEWRPAVLWTLDLDDNGELVSTRVQRRIVAQRRAAHLRRRAAGGDTAAARGRRTAASARTRARRRAPRGARAGGGPGGRRVDRELPGDRDSEEYNAQISLLTGMAAAQLMLRAGSASCGRSRRRRRTTSGGCAGPQSVGRGLASGRLLPRVHAQAGSGDGRPRRDHAGGHRRRARRGLTRPSTANRRRTRRTSRSPRRTRTRPRRCGGCRTATSPSAASRRMRASRHRSGCGRGCRRCPRRWSPRVGARGSRRARGRGPRGGGAARRAGGRALRGGRHRRMRVQLREPAVRGRLATAGPKLGSEVMVRLDRADPATRTVIFSV